MKFISVFRFRTVRIGIAKDHQNFKFKTKYFLFLWYGSIQTSLQITAFFINICMLLMFAWYAIFSFLHILLYVLNVNINVHYLLSILVRIFLIFEISLNLYKCVVTCAWGTAFVSTSKIGSMHINSDNFTYIYIYTYVMCIFKIFLQCREDASW